MPIILNLFSLVSFICKMYFPFSTTTDPYDSDKMAMEFLMQFPQQIFTVGQLLVFSFQDQKMLGLTVKEIEGKEFVSFLCRVVVSLNRAQLHVQILLEIMDNGLKRASS